MKTGQIANMDERQIELKSKVKEFYEYMADNPDKLITPAEAATHLDVTLRTLWNYRNKTDNYNNETADTDDDRSFKTVVDDLYTRLEVGILDWMSRDPKCRATAAALVLNKYFGYREDSATKMVNNFNGATKIEISPEMAALAQ